MTTNLRDEHVVVMGGTSGIGLATAVAALAAKAAVVVTSRGEQKVRAATERLGLGAS
jgi:NAD(P)-dependent dehydrogenase (short-subunit alcohol dehydrogenase family)